jgi:putative N6-adenine-specific DNA methylase
MGLEKRIKRHVVGPHHDFFAVTHPGFEALCRQELTALSKSVEIVAETKGGITFRGKMADLYRANLHVRTAGRFLLRLIDFSATNFRQFEKKAASLPWELFLPAGAVPTVKATCRHSRLYHSQAVAQRTTALMAGHWEKLGVPIRNDLDQTLFIRIEKDRITFSLDSSGANLYQRGLKTHHSPAPLRETLAAAILLAGGYQPRRSLADPMCGSGTFTLEAALMAKQIPPGFHRKFAFMDWPAFGPSQWNYFLAEAARMRRQCTAPLILASDQDEATCRKLSECIDRCRLNDAVTVRQRDFFAPPSDRSTILPPGLVVLNPPYGHRLKTDQPIASLYKAIGIQLRNRFPGWRLAMVVPNPRFARLMPFTATTKPLVHGGLNLALLTGRIPE